MDSWAEPNYLFLLFYDRSMTLHSLVLQKVFLTLAVQICFLIARYPAESLTFPTYTT